MPIFDKIVGHIQRWTTPLGLEAWRVEIVDGPVTPVDQLDMFEEVDYKEWAGAEVQPRYRSLEMTFDTSVIARDDHLRHDLEHVAVHEMMHAHTWRAHAALRLALKLLAQAEGIDTERSKVWAFIDWVLDELEEEHTEGLTMAVLRAATVPTNGHGAS